CSLFFLRWPFPPLTSARIRRVPFRDRLPASLFASLRRCPPATSGQSGRPNRPALPPVALYSSMRSAANFPGSLRVRSSATSFPQCKFSRCPPTLPREPSRRLLPKSRWQVSSAEVEFPASPAISFLLPHRRHTSLHFFKLRPRYLRSHDGFLNRQKHLGVLHLLAELRQERPHLCKNEVHFAAK